MEKPDWTALQAQFEHDHDKYGTTAKDWCNAKGLNYASARRYIKVRKTAQNNSAQSAQNKSAQSKSAQSGKKTRKTREDDKKKILDSSNDADFESCDLVNPLTDDRERDERGYFLPGNTVAVGNPGNTGEPTNAFEKGNQLRRKGGIYARLFPESKQEMFDLSQCATLEDELILTRTRLQTGIEYLQRIAEDLLNAISVEERIALYENYQKTENRMDVLTGRVESITKTLSSMGIDVVNKAKIIHDTARIKNASRKLALEADKLQNEGKGDDTPVASIVDEIQSMNKSGLMSG
jgi:hypothetical protein